MGNLRDQLNKAKLLSKKDVKRLAHEDRVHHKEVGGAAGVAQERAAHAAELRAEIETQRAADRAQQTVVQARREAAAEAAACAELLRREVHRPGRKGATRWYFELESGALPFLELPILERMHLTDGVLWVVRIGPTGTHDYGLMRAEHARRVAAVYPERIAYHAPA